MDGGTVFGYLMIYSIFILMLNLPLALIYIKMPFLKNRKKWQGKVDPIYKLECNEWHSYRIVKYVLCYHKYDDLKWWMAIPFTTMFCKYGYERQQEAFGSFTSERIEEEPLENIVHPYSSLGEYYEESKKLAIAEHEADMAEKNKFSNKMKSLNKEFIENYE